MGDEEEMSEIERKKKHAHIEKERKKFNVDYADERTTEAEDAENYEPFEGIVPQEDIDEAIA